MNKILIFIFIFLFLILVGEVVYYLVSFSSTQNQATTTTTVTQTNLDFPAQTRDLSKFSKIRNSGMILSSMFINKFQGTLSSIELKGNPLQRVKMTFYLNQSDFFNYEIEKNDLSKTSITEKNNGEINPIRFEELKKNDKLIIEYRMDLTKDIGSSILYIKITRVQKGVSL